MQTVRVSKTSTLMTAPEPQDSRTRISSACTGLGYFRSSHSMPESGVFEVHALPVIAIFFDIGGPGCLIGRPRGYSLGVIVSGGCGGLNGPLSFGIILDFVLLQGPSSSSQFGGGFRGLNVRVWASRGSGRSVVGGYCGCRGLSGRFRGVVAFLVTGVLLTTNDEDHECKSTAKELRMDSYFLLLERMPESY